MNAWQIISRGKAEYVKAEIPDLKPGYVLVKPKIISDHG